MSELTIIGHSDEETAENSPDKTVKLHKDYLFQEALMAGAAH